MIDDFYKGYIITNGKVPIESFKGRTDLKSYDEVKHAKNFAGVLKDDTVLIDLDDEKESEILLKLVQDQNISCTVYQTKRGRHFLFRDTKIEKCYTKITLCIGLVADIKVGKHNSIQILKTDGCERTCEWNNGAGEVPYWLLPTKRKNFSFAAVEEGSRNDDLFSFQLTLMDAGLTVEECKSTTALLNRFVLAVPLDDSEIETICRDEAYNANVGFFQGNRFCHELFASYIQVKYNVIMIDDQLYIYQDGIYHKNQRLIEAAMIREIPKLKRNQRNETVEYLKLIAPQKQPAPAQYIAFTNGVLDVLTGDLRPFSTEVVVTNLIPWKFDSRAYYEPLDTVLDRISCHDPKIRAILEECAGYWMYRRNELGMAFFLLGDKANGKSTFIKCIATMLGRENISTLDLKEMGERFNTAQLYGKLANLGDDISDDFLQGAQFATFKKVATGDMMKAEEKGQPPFFFSPYAKMLFSANEMPRIRDRTGAGMRRMVFIPFRAEFSKYREDGSVNPEYDPYISDKLTTPEAMEYLIRLGIEGLYRVLDQKGFTQSEESRECLRQYALENDVVAMFIEEYGDQIENQETGYVYTLFQNFCAEFGVMPISRQGFTKQITKKLNLKVRQSWIDSKNLRIFVKKSSVV